VGSTMSRLTEAGVYNHGGPEIGVASTKILALWYSPGCKIIVLSTVYVNISTFQHPEKRV